MNVKSPHVMVAGSAVRIFCSAECLESEAAGVTAVPGPEDLTTPAPRQRKGRKAVWIVAAVALASLAVAAGLQPKTSPRAFAPASVLTPAAPPPAAAPPAPKPFFGPPWPPSESDYLHELEQDAWIHPLAGPLRRMPKTDSRVFGAERPGERPVECLSGHCGVDLGGEQWGEPVHAVHDGVVDRVQRGPNDDHGGLYVRISHRDGTIYSQYFHLAAIPRWIQPGTRVKAGDVVGLLGDSGVFHSAPHLHFTLSVKASKDLPERYIDPESLIAIWPLWIPDAAVPGGLTVSTNEAPGVPLKSMRGGRRAQAAATDPAPTSSPPDP